jgi:serine/threonine-protein kinase
VGQTRLARRAADGTGDTTILLDEPNSWTQSISPDGRWLVYRLGLNTEYDLKVLDLTTGESRPMLAGPAFEHGGELSPNGRFLAYQSDESGSYEIFVRPFPNVEGGRRWQVSIGGGTEPLWSRDGRELFYRSANRMMAAPVDTGAVFRSGSPVELFRGRYRSAVGRYYDVAPDGSFVMVDDAAAEGDGARVVLIQNLGEELKRRLPAD